MHFFKRWKLMAGGLFLGLLVGFTFLCYQGWRIASPSRRVLQEYHKDWLNNQESHGIKIQEIICLDGKVPTLLVEPVTPLGERGQKLRKQLIERGVRLLPAGKVDHTVVLLHGRNGRKEDLLAVAERFCAVGLRCILVDLPAHGESEVKTVKFGVYEWEQDLPYRVLLECADKFNFSPEHASLWGMSMGGSFANSAVADPEHGSHWRSLIVVCSFDRLELVIKEHCHSESLTSLVSEFSQYFDGVDLRKASPAEWVQGVTTPVMVVHGDADQFIPMERGLSLYSSYAGSDKKWVKVPGGTHKNILITPMPLYAEMAEWILQH